MTEPASQLPPQDSPRKDAPRIPHVQRRPESPRRVRDGFKLRALKDDGPRSILTQRWIDLIVALTHPDELSEGIEYARAGQIASLDHTDGRIVSLVQGRRSRPYRVEIVTKVLSAVQWSRLVEQMSKEAIYAAALLSSEVPEQIHELFESIELELIPSDATKIETSCDCERPKPCRHIAAAGYIIAERLQREPHGIFALRGLPADQLLDRLRHAREIRTHGVASAHADPMIPETQMEPLPLAECLDDFWRSGRELSEVEKAPPGHHVNHALLRRLGPSPLLGKFPLVGLLASIYDSVAQYATDLRDRAEGIDRVDVLNPEVSETEAEDSD